MATSDHNLLFGVLALQLEFISRDDLIAAMNAWAVEKCKPLGQILVERGCLAAELRAVLEELVCRQGGGGRSGTGPAPSGPAGPNRDAPRQGGGPPGPGGSSPTYHNPATAEDRYLTRDPGPGPSAGMQPRYRILRRHAQGGLGDVFVAHDEELQREVALKEIRASHADDPDSRSRFLLEAEITSRLEHPGIVPVYGLGQHSDGRPFYAMRFIKGESLKDAIGRFHEDNGPASDTGARGLALRQLIGHFLDVCQAIAYAHSRGVLHRDLKPGNIMLGQYGETLVVDWGLAKTFSRPAGAARPGEGSLRPANPGNHIPTQMGRVIGTPEFMSPEQAAGELDRLGPASDVYSLGATLYCLLTGRAPFEEADLGTLLCKVRGGEFVPPRKLNPRVPAGLESICLRAMRLRPADRYPSCSALAQDVERWLADQPVAAYPEPWMQRLGRWVAWPNSMVGRLSVLLPAVLGALRVAMAC